MSKIKNSEIELRTMKDGSTQWVPVGYKEPDKRKPSILQIITLIIQIVTVCIMAYYAIKIQILLNSMN